MKYVIVRGMDMPENCAQCGFCNRRGDWGVWYCYAKKAPCANSIPEAIAHPNEVTFRYTDDGTVIYNINKPDWCPLAEMEVEDSGMH